jgi:integrase
MARNKEFWVEPRTRKYQPRSGGELQVRRVFRACWIGPDGLVDSAEREGWTQKAALEFAAEQWQKVRGGTFVTKSTATMDDAIKIWLEELEERHELTLKGAAPTTKRGRRKTACGAYLKNMRSLAERFLSPMFGPEHPGTVNDKYYIQQWWRRVVKNGEMTPFQVHYAYKRVLLVLDVAKDKGWIAINQLRVDPPDLPEVESANVNVPEDDDMVEVLRLIEPDYCPPKDNELLFSTMRMAIFLVAYAGLRPNEASALRWEDVNLDRLEINQHRGFTYEEGHKLKGKTRASKRLIDILPQLHHEFREYQRRTAEIAPQDGRLVTWQAMAERNANPDTGLVLCNAYMGTLSAESIGIHWRKLRRRATERDLEPFDLYSLRHYAGSVWLRDLGPKELPRISRMMGHSNIETTEQVYIKILREMDEIRLNNMHQIGSGLDRRYRALGLNLGYTPVPALAAPEPIAAQTQLLPPAPQDPVDQPEPIEPLPPMAPINIKAIKETAARQVLAMFDARMNLNAIARKTGLSAGTIRNIIDDRYTEMRTGPSKWHMSAEERAERDAEARRLAEEEGLSYREIAALLGMRVASLRQVACRQGWKAARKRVTYNQPEYKGTPAERARGAEAMRRHRERQKLIAAGEPIPPELEKRPSIPGPIVNHRPKMSDEERKAQIRAWKQSEAGRESAARYRQSEKNRDAQHRYKTSEKGRAKAREYQRKRRQPVEITCDCGRTFSLIPRSDRPRTLCDQCRNAAYEARRRQLRVARAAPKADAAPAQVVTK